MEHVIFILAHKNFNQLRRLTDKLVQEFDIIIHIDKKTVLTPEDLEIINKFHDNVFFIENRLNIQLAHMSMVKIIKLFLETTLKLETIRGKSYSYCLLLSGQDYPLYNASKIKLILDDLYPALIIDIHHVTLQKWMYSVISRHRFISWHNNIYSKFGRNTLLSFVLIHITYFFEIFYTLIFGSPKKKFTRERIEVYAGSAWWILPKKDLQVIFSTFASKKNLNKIYRHILAPEEHFFQTMLQYCELGILLNQTQDYLFGPTYACFNHPTKGPSIDGHPFVLESGDYNNIDFKNYLFARKFDTIHDIKILDRLDQFHSNQL